MIVISLQIILIAYVENHLIIIDHLKQCYFYVMKQY